MMNFETDEIKLKALNESIYFPSYKEENPIKTIELEEFDCEEAKTLLKDSIELISYEQNYKPLIVEILDILDKNKDTFFINYHKYLCFYWNGIPIVKIVVLNGSKQDKILHISLQRYKKEKEDRVSDKKIHRLLTGGLIGSLVIGAAVVGLSFFKNK